MLRGRLQRAVVAPCVTLAFAGCTAHGGSRMNESGGAASAPFSAGVSAAVVRYQVLDVDRAVAFYTERLGFRLAQRSGPVFATVSRGDLHLLLSGPGSSGSRPMPDGRKQEPGGWNRIVVYVKDIDSTIDALRRAGTRFRNEVEVGQIGRASCRERV